MDSNHERTAGPSARVLIGGNFGRDDKHIYNLSSRPERSVVEGPASIRSMPNLFRKDQLLKTMQVGVPIGVY